MARWVVTGACGGLGRQVCEQLLHSGQHVVGVDVAEPSVGDSPLSLPSDRFTYVKGDVRSPEVIHAVLQDADYLIHLAALTIHAAHDDPLRALDVNSRSLVMMLDSASKSSRPPVVVFASTATLLNVNPTFELRGQRADGPRFAPDSAHSPPVNFYAATKFFNELLANHWRARGIRVVGVRLGLVTFPFGGQGLSRQIVDALVSDPSIGLDSSVPCADDFPNWLSPTDAATACIEAAKLAEAGSSQEIYNVLGEFRSMREAIDLAQSMFPKVTLSGIPGTAGLDQRGGVSDSASLGVDEPESLESQLEALKRGRLQAT